MIVAYEDGLEMAPGRTHPLVGLLLKNESKWPKIPHKAIADGNKEVGSLLFGISFHKSLF